MGLDGSRLPPDDGPIRAILSPYPTVSPPTADAGAAVTIVLREGGQDVEVLLIERTTRDDDPASGQVALPGGRVEPSDRDLRETAMRELDEEVGLGASDLRSPVRFVGTERSRQFAMAIGVFAAELGPGSQGPRRSNVREVAHIFWLPKGRLATTERVRRDTSRGAIDVDATRFDGHVLWGFTRSVLKRFLRVE